MRRFAGTIRGNDFIKTLNPLVRWGVDDMDLSSNLVQSVNGQYNPYILTAPSGQEPNYNSTENSIELDGVNDILQNTVDRIILSNPTQSELIGVFYIDNSSTSNSYLFIGLSTSSRLIIFSTNQKFQIASANNSATLDRVETLDTFSTGFYLCSFIADGSSYKIHVNNPLTESSLNLVSGVNTGRWSGGISGVASSTATKILIGDITGLPNYRPTEFKDIVYFDRVLNSTEREGVFNQLNEKYNIY